MARKDTVTSPVTALSASSPSASSTAPASPPPRRPRERKLGLVPGVAATLLVLCVLVALAADLLAPHSPLHGSLSQRLQPPFWLEGGSLEYPLGTDQQGRDILSRVIFGARASLIVALASVMIAGTVGTAIGVLAGFYGGLLDVVVMRVVDAVIGLPLILFALLLAVTMGPGLSTVVYALVIVIWARYARVVRGETLAIKERDFVTAARVIGCSNLRIMVRYLLPNVFPAVLVIATLQLGIVVIAEASLSFLGAGVPPPRPAWGSMIASGRDYMSSAWWIALFPGLAIMLYVLSMNVLGDWLRDVLDPRLRGVLR